LSTLYFLRIQMPVILSFFNTRDLYCRCASHAQTDSEVRWLVPDRAIKGKSQKDWKMIRVVKKT